MQGSCLQIDVSEIVVDEADEPNVGVDLAQSEALAGEDRGDDDLTAVKADGAVAGGDDVEVVEGIGELGQAGEGPGRGRVAGAGGAACRAPRAGAGC